MRTSTTAPTGPCLNAPLRHSSACTTTAATHIWAYYTRNLVRPVALRADPVDVIVGNPPWLTYNRTEAVVREELERQSKERYLIWAGGRYATHQDIAGMFFARATELYLKPDGKAAMVLPHSALQTGQYTKWRTGQWGVLSVDLGAPAAVGPGTDRAE